MTLQNLSTNTQWNYISGVERLSRYYQASPVQISEDEIRKYIIFLKKESVSCLSRNWTTECLA